MRDYEKMWGKLKETIRGSYDELLREEHPTEVEYYETELLRSILSHIEMLERYGVSD